MASSERTGPVSPRSAVQTSDEEGGRERERERTCLEILTKIVHRPSGGHRRSAPLSTRSAILLRIHRSINRSQLPIHPQKYVMPDSGAALPGSIEYPFRAVSQEITYPRGGKIRSSEKKASRKPKKLRNRRASGSGTQTNLNFSARTTFHVRRMNNSNEGRCETTR